MRRTRVALLAVGIATAAVFAPTVGAHARERPFILWTKEDAAALRHKVKTEPWAKAAYQQMLEHPDPHEEHLINLFRYTVMGEREPGEVEKQVLLATARSPAPRGAAQYLNVLRYDQLYDLLTADERRQVERCFREYIDNHVFKRAVLTPMFNNSRNYARYDAREYTRSNWLPNIIWPWKVSANLMAVALQDEQLIRKTWAAYGSWQWYFDEYLCDTGFYAEEFSKMGSTPGAMLLYCMGLERLGLDKLGFGYTGKVGATMRGHIESLTHLGYPRVDLGSSRPHYPMVTLGDLRQGGSSQDLNLPGYAFQHSLVMGYLPDGTGGTPRWIRHGAWGGEKRGNSPQWDQGKTPKMLVPLWFEIGHQRWPDAGFDYFLAQMRAPDEKVYTPSLYFGLDPIDPKKVEPPPAPSAPSAVWPERGLAMLRAEESPAYWDSSAPAVCLRLATNYAHNVNDCFALVGFYAFNRPIYLNRQSCHSYAQGYSRSIQSHCGVVVDGQEPQFTAATMVRSDFSEPVKFVSARSKEVYADVDLTRALFLTREYLLDITALDSSRPRSYHWLVHAVGPPPELAAVDWKRCERIDGLLPDFTNVHRRATEYPWSVTVEQKCPLEDPTKTALGREWYARRIGVRMSMLGEPGTTAYLADTPQMEPDPRKPPPGPDEIGGTTIVAHRNCPSTVFVALHEPFQGGTPPTTDYRLIGRSEGALGVVVRHDSPDVNDRILLSWRDEKQSHTLGDKYESYVFSGWAFVRIGRRAIEVRGHLKGLKIPSPGNTKLLLNGREQKATVRDGNLCFGELDGI